MAADELSKFDIALRIWAVAGPVIVAAVSAWWSRKNKIEDREYEKRRDSERFERECRLKEEEGNKIASEKEYNFVLEKIVNFVAAETEFTRSVVEYKDYPVDHTNPEDSKFYQNRVMKAAKGSTDLHNRLMELILVTNGKLDKYAEDFYSVSINAIKIKVDSAEYINTRLAFIAAARKYLSQYRIKTITTEKAASN